MDTYKDAVVLNDLWAAGGRPWRAWDATPRGRGRWRATRSSPAPAASSAPGSAGRCSSAARGRLARPRRGRTGRLSALGAARDRGRGGEVDGDLLDAELVDRALATHGVRRRLPPRRRDDRRHGRRVARCATSRPTCAAPGRCWRPAWRTSVERVVVASSDKAYGAHDELPYREDFALQPTAPYEASKAAADLIARSYWRATACRSR